MQRSGNSYKVRLALAQLGVDYRLVEVDILKGDSHTPEFLQMNPNGQVPLLEVGAQPSSCGIERHSLVRRRRHAARSRRQDRTRRSVAVDVLRAAQPGAQYRRRLFLAGAGERRPRAATSCARGLDGGRLPGAARDGEPSQAATTTSRPAATPSPTSRSMPIRTSPISATTTSERSPRSGAGSIASSRSPATSRWTGSRSRSKLHNDAAGAVLTKHR